MNRFIPALRQIKIAIVFTVSLVLVGACATSSTGRSQLLLMPARQMDEMGVAAFTDLKKKGDLKVAAGASRYVNCVANAITASLPAAERGGWEVVVFQDDSANAFALPGRKIGVHTGLLQVAENQQQLAAVIGHEVGHVMEQHGNERMSIAFASQTSQQLVGAMLEESADKPMLMAAMGVGAQLGVQLPYSRSHESEADIIGLELMAKAGFDPRGSVQLWRNMGKNAGQTPPELLSTHPAGQTRIDALQSNMAGAMKLYQVARGQGKKPRCSEASGSAKKKQLKR